MVFRKSEKGGGWHEPPYTWKEEMEFYRRYNRGMASGHATIYRGQPKTAGKPAPEAAPQQDERQKRE